MTIPRALHLGDFIKMQNQKNPLRVHFAAALSLLFFSLLEACMVFIRGNGLSEISTYSWTMIHKIIYFIGFSLFILFYVKKSLAAWYVLIVMFTIILPVSFLIGIVGNSITISGRFFMLLAIFWCFICSDLLNRYKSYKKHLEDI
jgi:hypothetical protein